MAIRQPGELREHDRVKIQNEQHLLHDVEARAVAVRDLDADIQYPDGTRVTIERSQLVRLVSPQEMVDEMHREQPEIDAARGTLLRLRDGAVEKIAEIKNAEDRKKIATVIDLVSTMAQQVLEAPSLATLPKLFPSASKLVDLIGEELRK